MEGIVKQYRADNHYGFIEADDKTEFFFLGSSINGHYGYSLRGNKVSFDVKPTGKMHDEAVNITVVETVEKRRKDVPKLIPFEERTGHGTWRKVSSVKGKKYLCSDCGGRSAEMGKFCSVCGAVMSDPHGRRLTYKASNKENTHQSRIPECKPDARWIEVDEGLACSSCGKKVKKPTTFCCECGKWMERFLVESPKERKERNARLHGQDQRGN